MDWVFFHDEIPKEKNEKGTVRLNGYVKKAFSCQRADGVLGKGERSSGNGSSSVLEC